MYNCDISHQTGGEGGGNTREGGGGRGVTPSLSQSICIQIMKTKRLIFCGHSKLNLIDMNLDAIRMMVGMNSFRSFK